MTEYYNLKNNEISKELLVDKFNTILGNYGRLTPMVTKASQVTRYCKITQRRSLDNIGCLNLDI